MTNEKEAQRLTEITARVKSTTPGEWAAFGLFGGYEIVARGQGRVLVIEKVTDAAFIANSKADIQWLLEMVKKGGCD